MEKPEYDPTTEQIMAWARERLTDKQKHELLTKDEQTELGIGELLCDSNPYVVEARAFGRANSKFADDLRSNPKFSMMLPDLNTVEEGYEPTMWEFNGDSYKVASVLRIAYSYTSKAKSAGHMY